MKNRNTIIVALNFLSGICFFLAALIGKNYVFIPIGCCFVVLGIVNQQKKNADDDDK